MQETNHRMILWGIFALDGSSIELHPLDVELSWASYAPSCVSSVDFAEGWGPEQVKWDMMETSNNFESRVFLRVHSVKISYDVKSER